MTKYRKYWNEQMETLSFDEYHEIQSKALVKELEYVWQNSTFYQEKFKEAGIDLGDIKGIDDLYKLPFTEKDELEVECHFCKKKYSFKENEFFKA